MDKRKLVRIIDEILSPLGFNRKGNYWVLNGEEITRMVNLQRSQFSERFYLNYGYVLKSIPLDELKMHVFNGFGSLDPNENARIKKLLDLESDVEDVDREKELKKLLQKFLVEKLCSVKTEEHLRAELLSRPNLNDVPLVTRKHYNLE